MGGTRLRRQGAKADVDAALLPEGEDPAIARLHHPVRVLELHVGMHPALASMRGLGVGAGGDAVDLFAVPRAPQLLAKGGAHAVGHDDPAGGDALLAHNKGGQPVSVELRCGGRPGDEPGAGVPGGVNQQCVELVARQGRAHLAGVGGRPRRGDGAAEAVELQPAVAVGGVDVDAQQVQLVHGARGEAVAAGLIAGEGGGIDQQRIVTGPRGVDGCGGTGGTSANDGDVCKDGIELLRHGHYHCTG